MKWKLNTLTLLLTLVSKNYLEKSILNEEVFKKAFVVAEIANFNERELATYEESLKIFRDNINTLRYAINEGKEEGKELGKKQGVKEGRREGIKEGLKETVTIQLCKKFKLDKLPDILEQKLDKAAMNILQEIRDNIFEFDSLDEVKYILG